MKISLPIRFTDLMYEDGVREKAIKNNNECIYVYFDERETDITKVIGKCDIGYYNDGIFSLHDTVDIDVFKVPNGDNLMALFEAGVDLECIIRGTGTYLNSNYKKVMGYNITHLQVQFKHGI